MGRLLLRFFLVIPNLLSKPKLFDLMDNRISIRFEDAGLFVLPFEDIKRLRFYDPVAKKKRPLLFKVLDSWYLEDDLALTFFQLLRNKRKGIPYSFGFSSKEGAVYVERIGAISFLRRLFLPWLNVRGKAKLIALTPANPKEFFEQLTTAYEKWKRHNPRNAERNRSPVVVTREFLSTNSRHARSFRAATSHSSTNY